MDWINVKLVCRYFRRCGDLVFDPSEDDNKAIRVATSRNLPIAVSFLLRDRRVDTSANLNEAFSNAWFHCINFTTDRQITRTTLDMLIDNETTPPFFRTYCLFGLAALRRDYERMESERDEIEFCTTVFQDVTHAAICYHDRRMLEILWDRVDLRLASVSAVVLSFIESCVALSFMDGFWYFLDILPDVNLTRISWKLVAKLIIAEDDIQLALVLNDARTRPVFLRAAVLVSAIRSGNARLIDAVLEYGQIEVDFTSLRLAAEAQNVELSFQFGPH